jgi:hypothetical protein
MICYIPASQGEPLTRALWRLAVPDPETGATDKMFEVFDDLQTPSQRWLMVDTTFTIRVHPDAVLDGIADILQPWIDGGHLPADTNDVLAAFVESKRGQDLTVYEAFPHLFKDLSLTTAQMIAAGKLANPEVTP